MCGPDDRNRYGRRPRVPGEADRDFNRDGRCFGPPDCNYGRDFRRPGPNWRGECCPPEDEHWQDYDEDECCCCEDDGPAMLADLADDLDGMVNEVMGDLVREKIMKALEERLGDKLDRLVAAVVDAHIADVDDLLNGRETSRPDLIEKFAEILLEDYEGEKEFEEKEAPAPKVEIPEKKKAVARKKKKS